MRLRLTLILALTLPAHAAMRWVGTWATAPTATPNTTATFATDTTLRQTVHVSAGGPAFRIVLTNEFGTDPLQIGAAAITLPGSSLPVTFSSQPSVTIPPGAIALSDPIALKLPALADLTLTLFLPAQTLRILTRHAAAFSTSYLGPGNQLTAATLTSARPVTSWHFLKSIDVESTGAAIVAFGDSITDGAQSTLNANARWTDELARRLQGSPATNRISVLNEGIGGNRILRDIYGPSALARFDRDALSLAGVQTVILLEGINDIGHTTDKPGPENVTAADLIFGMQQLITRAHAHGLRILGATLTPYQGAGYSTATGEQIREAVNAFIRAPGHFDAVLDFERTTQDPTHPLALNPAFDSGDHLHPKDAGYKAMGDSIDLKLFAK